MLAAACDRMLPWHQRLRCSSNLGAGFYRRAPSASSAVISLQARDIAAHATASLANVRRAFTDASADAITLRHRRRLARSLRLNAPQCEY